MKIFMVPDKAELGIGRVVDAYHKHLPLHGFEFVIKEEQADIIVTHAGHQTSRQPDVHHCHGLYPTATLDQSENYFEMNADVIENIRTAKIVVVPSQWVADILRRDMLLNPVVLPHGIDVDDWPMQASNQGYILWAKGHQPGVCDPEVVNQLAEKLPYYKFVTTFGEQVGNVEVIGLQSFPQMKVCIQRAGVYLATTKETFGIQVMEAMASGVPVVGYNWGGVADIITHGENGYLVEPGNVDGLVEGVQWLNQNRGVVAKNARHTVETRFSWDVVCKQLADIYNSIPEDTKPMVSIVVPCYNYADRVVNAIEGALGQQTNVDFEVIVVNDGSTDKSGDTISKYSDKVTIITMPNQGVAAARNAGIRQARGQYIACVDADDKAVPEFIAKLLPPLLQDRGLGIAYGSLQIVYDEGKHSRKGDWPPDFCYMRQVSGSNQVPSACIFRKDAWERAGGYRAKYTPAEDAELWLRMTTLGYDAKKVTEDVTYTYDAHQGSLSRRVKGPGEVFDKPWAANKDLVPFAAPSCDYKHDSFPVRNYDDPWVSIIIPVGPGHENVVHRAVDGVWLQSLPYWECIVVNDSGKPLVQPSTGRTLQEAYPFLKIIELNSGNVSKARNAGVAAAKAQLLVFLDADDELDMHYLTRTIDVYNENPDHYVYTDWLSDDGKARKSGGREFDCEGLKLQALHPVTALVPKAWHVEAGGFDEQLGVQGWEDWDYFLKIVIDHEHCGVRVPEPLVIYNISDGVRRETSLENKESLIPIIKGRYGNKMCKRCGKPSHSPAPPSQSPPVLGKPAVNVPMASGRGRGTPMPPSVRPNRSVEEGSAVGDNMVMVMDNSGNVGAHGVVGASTRTKYGRKIHGQPFAMDIRDQRSQPHLYILQQVQQPMVQTPMPARPAVTVSTPVPVPPAVVTTMSQLVTITTPPVSEKPEEAKLAAFSADEEGIDISLLTLQQIKMLGLDPESASEAYEAEAMDKARKGVLQYLQGVAGDALKNSAVDVDEEE